MLGCHGWICNILLWKLIPSRPEVRFLQVVLLFAEDGLRDALGVHRRPVALFNRLSGFMYRCRSSFL